MAMRVAAVDIGTNSTRLLVADYLPDDLFDGDRLEWLDRRVVVTGLGRGVDASGRLAEDAIGRTVAVLAGFREAVRNWAPEQKAAVATSAVRDAVNRDEFLERATVALGFRPVVIDGEEEARLSFQGAVSGIEGEAPYLIIDPGGGSTEFVMGETEPTYVRSVDIGSVRLTERALPRLPASAEDLVASRREADRVLEVIELPQPPGTVIGTGGTFTSLAALALGLNEYDPTKVHGTLLDLDAVADTITFLAGKTLDEIRALPALDPARAGVILGGAVVVERALMRAGVSGAVVSETDILDGLALRLGRGEGPLPSAAGG